MGAIPLLWDEFKWKRTISIPADLVTDTLYNFQLFLYLPFLKKTGTVKFQKMDGTPLDWERRDKTKFVVQMDITPGTNYFRVIYGEV